MHAGSSAVPPNSCFIPLGRIPRDRSFRMSPRRTIDHSMSADAFARLLAALHADPDEAAVRYERLRLTLTRFFDWRGIWPPDECADDTLDRLARRLAEDTPVQDVQSYAYGIARLVLLERRRRPSVSALDERVENLAAAGPTGRPDSDQEDLRTCFDSCLAQLPNETRTLLLGYYEGERRAKILNRRRLATSHGLSENALRSRVLRLRDRLERCVQSCASAGVQEGRR